MEICDMVDCFGNLRRHSRAGGNPALKLCRICLSWIPAYAGMTENFCPLCLLFSIDIPTVSCHQRRNRINLVVQISPAEVHFFNNSDFPIALPFFQLLFAAYCPDHLAMMLIPNQKDCIIIRGKTAKSLILMIVDAAPEITCNADVNRAPVTVRSNVNSWRFFVMHLVCSTRNVDQETLASVQNTILTCPVCHSRAGGNPAKCLK